MANFAFNQPEGQGVSAFLFCQFSPAPFPELANPRPKQQNNPAGKNHHFKIAHQQASIIFVEGKDLQ